MATAGDGGSGGVAGPRPGTSPGSGDVPGRPPLPVRTSPGLGERPRRMVRGAPLTLAIYVTFSCMGFGTGWSGVDSIFQQVNKYIVTYDDLSIASDLVYVTSAAAATVLVVAFLGLYCAPAGVDFRTERFFENTISFVLVVSCTVMLVLALCWDKGEWVVMATAFAAAVMGNLQTFIIYPFFNAFYRTRLISSLNLGETATSLVCGSLALAQSPAAGVENFTATQFFVAVLACSVLASAAWASLGWQTGYRKEDEERVWALRDGQNVPDGCVLLGDDGRPIAHSETEAFLGVSEENAETPGRPKTSYGATAEDGSETDKSRQPRTTSPEPGRFRRSWNETLLMNREVMESGGAMARGAHGIALPSATSSEAGVDGKQRSPSYFDVREAVSASSPKIEADEETGRPDDPFDSCGPTGPYERVGGLFRNVTAVVSRSDSEVKWLLPLATLNTLLTWSVISAFLPFSAAAAIGTCDTQDADARAFIRQCTAFSSILRIVGPLCVRTDKKMWGHPLFVRLMGVIGVAINATFCAPALFGSHASSPSNAWNSERGRAVLFLAYVVSTPLEPFMQLHLLVATQRENRGSSKRIIDAGFAFAAIVVTLSFGVACAAARFAATGTKTCPEF